MDNLVTFRVGESLYALPADLVAEVVEIGPIAHQVLADEGGGPGAAGWGSGYRNWAKSFPPTRGARKTERALRRCWS